MKITHHNARDEKYIEELIKQSLKSIMILSNAKDKESITELTEQLIKLADLKQESGRVTRDIEKYTDAAIFYNHAISVIDINKNLMHRKDQIQFELQSIKDSVAKLISIEGQQVLDINEESKQYRNILKELRDDIKKQIPDNISFGTIDPNQAKKLFNDISTRLKEFLALLIKDSERELGSPPCDYSVIGLGSLALNQATPYSDLEFGIIVEKDSVDIQRYFKNLTHLVNLKVINLGETVAPRHYNLNLDNFIQKGVMLDPGGKTPLGENGKLGVEKYALIKTLDGMLKFLYNEDELASSIDKNLHRILEKTCFIYSFNFGLHDNQFALRYQDAANKFLFNDATHAKRAIETLITGGFELESRTESWGPYKIEFAEEGEKKIFDESDLVNYGSIEKGFAYGKAQIQNQGHVSQGVPINFNRVTINKFNPGDLSKFAQESKGISNAKPLDVKQEIYRLCDRLIYSIGMYFKTKNNSIFDVIDDLEIKCIINDEASRNLKHATTFAMILRLKLYLDTDGHSDEIPLAQLNYGNEDSNIFKFFYVAFPLRWQIAKFMETCLLNKESIEQVCLDKSCAEIFQDNSFYRDDSYINGILSYRLAKYDNAIKHLEEHLDSGVLLEKKIEQYIFSILGDSYFKLENGEKAVEYLKKSILYLEEEQHEQYDKIDFLFMLSNQKILLAESYIINKQYKEGLDITIKAISNLISDVKSYPLKNKDLKQKFFSTSSSIYKIKAFCHLGLKQYEDAIKECNGAITLDAAIGIKNCAHYYCVGEALLALNKFQEAVRSYEIAINLDDNSSSKEKHKAMHNLAHYKKEREIGKAIQIVKSLPDQQFEDIFQDVLNIFNKAKILELIRELDFELIRPVTNDNNFELLLSGLISLCIPNSD